MSRDITEPADSKMPFAYARLLPGIYDDNGPTLSNKLTTHDERRKYITALSKPIGHRYNQRMSSNRKNLEQPFDKGKPCYKPREHTDKPPFKPYKRY